MKKILLPVILLTIGLILTIPISAAGEGTVTATVTPKLISVAVSPNTIIYGTVALGQNDVAPTSDTEIGVNNNGTVSEKLSIKGNYASAIVGCDNILLDSVGILNWHQPIHAQSTVWILLLDNY